MRPTTLLLRVVPLALLAACASGSPAPVASVPSDAPLFALHSNFWINLNQELHHVSHTHRSLASRAGWPADFQRAVSDYAGTYGTRDPIFDREMARIDQRLASLGSAVQLDASGLPSDLVNDLLLAAPYYRESIWPVHDLSNRRWIAAVVPAVRAHGVEIARRLSAVLRAPWPEMPVPVDLTFTAGPFGAYTTLEPMHTTIGSGDERTQGIYSLESLVHEAAHGMIAPVERAIARSASAHHVAAPPNLWHAVLFATAGDAVSRALVSPDYVPYAVHRGLWTRGAFRAYARVIDAHWRPYLAGEGTMESAIDAMVLDLANPEPPMDAGVPPSDAASPDAATDAAPEPPPLPPGQLTLGMAAVGTARAGFSNVFFFNSPAPSGARCATHTTAGCLVRDCRDSLGTLVAGLDGGRVQVRWGRSTGATIAPSAPGNTYALDSQNTPRLATGDVVAFDSDGGVDLPPLHARLALPRQPAMREPRAPAAGHELNVDRSAPLAVAWDPLVGTTLVFLAQQPRASEHWLRQIEAECEFDGTLGHATVPAAVLGEFAPSSSDTAANLAIGARASVDVPAGPRSVRVVVQGGSSVNVRFR